MAIRTEELEILEPVVVAVSVHVMKRHRDRLSLPLLDPTNFAAMRLETAVQEAQLEVMPVDLAPLDEVGVDGRGRGS
jgi:hypothetical protein